MASIFWNKFTFSNDNKNNKNNSSDESNNETKEFDSDSSEDIPVINEYYKKLKITKDSEKKESFNENQLAKKSDVKKVEWKVNYNDLKKKNDTNAIAMHPGIFENRKFTDLSETEVQGWALSLQYNDTQKNIYGKGIDGNYLIKNIKTKKDIPRLLNIKNHIDIKRVWDLINNSKTQKTKNILNLTKNNNNMLVLTKDYKYIPIEKWIINDCKSWIKYQINKSLNLSKLILNKIYICFDNNNVDGLYLISIENEDELIKLFENIQFEMNKIKNNKILNEIAIEMQTQLQKRLKLEKKQLISFNLDESEVKTMEFDLDKERDIDINKYKHIKLSKKKDLIFQYTDEDGITRAEMSCGCAMSAQSMFYYLKTLAESGYELNPLCPNGECKKLKKQWNWGMCIMVADLTKKEENYLNDLKFRRESGNQQLCPYCNSLVLRPDNLKNFRVNCKSCSNNDWCWSCKKSWKTSSILICGNKNCKQTEKIDNINETLKNAQRINEDIGYISEIMTKDKKNDIPKLRACVKCMSIIEWKTACKHVECPACEEEFCFLCLKTKKNGNWQCGSHRNACPVAPKQSFK